MTERGEELWRIITVPSLAEPGDPLGRTPGEALLPEGPNMRTVEELRQIQSKNPSLFMAMHQQRPVAEGGEIFKKGWLRPYEREELPPRYVTYIATDYAMSTSGGDYTVLFVFGVCPKGHIWLLDRYRSQCSILDGIEQTILLMKQHKPLRCYIERTAMAKAYGPLLSKRRVEEGAWTVVEDVSIMGMGGKASPERAGAIAGAMEAGYVHVPAHVPWYGELEYELSHFPGGEHDDQVDALCLIGLKLDSLRKVAAPKAEATGGEMNPLLNLKGMTFSQAVDGNRRRRMGLPVPHRWLVARN
jgi:predicted phage terminase large subunit-like protein